MIINVNDSQVVGETSSTLWSTINQGPTEYLLIIKNSGVNTMNYRVQEYTGTAWSDLGSSGSDYYNTLSAGEVRQFVVESNYPQTQMIGNASGGAFLEFSMTRFANRASGGSIPVLSL